MSSASTQGTWRKPDGSRFDRSPIAFQGDTVVVSELFLQDKVCKNMEKVAKSDKAYHGLFAVLHFVFDPKVKLYQTIEEDDRVGKVLESHVDARSHSKVRKLMATDQFQELKDFFIKIITTRSERMLIMLEKQIDAFISKLNELDDEDDVDERSTKLLKRIGRAEEIQSNFEALKKRVNQEGLKRSTGGYRPTLFERRPEHEPILR